MITKNEIKYIKSLQYKKWRNSNNCFVVEGEKIVDELINSSFKIATVYAEEEWIKKNIGNSEIQIKSVNAKELKLISGFTTPNKVLAVVVKQTDKLNVKSLENKLSLVFDRIQDPGNFGTIIRTADWFGVKNIVCSLDSVEVYSPKVIQASMGSIFRVNIYNKELIPFFKEVKNETKLVVYGTFLEGISIYEKQLKEEGLIVMGNESEGISESLFPFINEKLFILNYSIDKIKAESLNVAVATAIVCSEFRRR